VGQRRNQTSERFFTAWRPSRRSSTRGKAGRHYAQNDAAGVWAAEAAHDCRRTMCADYDRIRPAQGFEVVEGFIGRAGADAGLRPAE
jgi:hypothetical protein